MEINEICEDCMIKTISDKTIISGDGIVEIKILNE